ncbi:MAG: hypothetical protein M0008_12850 [Actinomycetota bacterium]|nr:hypothetical protein [Actinomycetota bacterium]
MARNTTRHDVEWVAAGLRRAAAGQGVEVPVVYARRVAADALAREAALGVTRLGAGVVIHTAPEAKDRLPIVVGYADARGQRYRDGSRHVEATPVEVSTEAVGVELGTPTTTTTTTAASPSTAPTCAISTYPTSGRRPAW